VSSDAYLRFFWFVFLIQLFAFVQDLPDLTTFCFCLIFLFRNYAEIVPFVGAFVKI
jgi:hypothetical protein